MKGDRGELSRRTLLVGGALLAAGAVSVGGYELVHHDDVSGKRRLDKAPGVTGQPGPAISGRFFSRARNTEVGWTISYPPGHRAGDRLPLVLALHGYTGSHVHPIGPVSPDLLLDSTHHAHPLPAMAVAAIDGGNDYWHAHPGDDPMRMLLTEFLPMCRRRGLGLGKIGLTGVSMGGYGALLLAEEHPDLVAAVAVISPAVWTTYADSQNANPDAFTSAADFAEHDVITHAAALRGIPVRVASGRDDPFHPYVEALASALPEGSKVRFPPGAHDQAFFGSQAVPSLAFLGHHLSRSK